MPSAAEIEPEQSLIPADAVKGSPGSSAKKCGGCCCCCLCFLLAVLYFAVYPVFSNMAVSEFLQIHPKIRRYTGDGFSISNLTYKVSWPGCSEWEEGQTFDRFETSCPQECFSADLPKAVQASLDDSLAQLVRYTSRAADGIETIELSGWWIPAEGNASEAPRIVYQHGFQSNSNSRSALLTAHFLRSMGYSVLINNLRDHGYSNSSQKRLQEWGDAYTYDLLGAWDYLVNDPDGMLGGPLPPGRVGLQGASKGGFLTLNAFGLEPRVPAAWVDSPPCTPRAVFTAGVERTAKTMGLGWLAAGWLQNMLYADVLAYARDRNVDLEKNTPEKNLPMGPDTQRRLFMTTNPADEVVPVSEYQEVLSLLEGYPDKYSVESMYTHTTCSPDSHTEGMLMETEKYVGELCKFWRSTFGEDASTC